MPTTTMTMTMTIDDLQELRTMRVAWQALARRWALSRRDLALLLPEGGEDRPQPPADTERRMRLMLAVDYRLPFGFDDGELATFIATPIDDLGGLTPVEVMAEGPAHIRELRDWAEWRYS